MTFAFPVIRSQDYQTFRDAIGPDLADTYDEWLKLHSKQVDEARRSGNLTSSPIFVARQGEQPISIP